MNFNKPNFTQFKIDQAKLEKIPTIKPDFHFIINDISKKVLSQQILTDKELGDLEMVYSMTQDLEKELITFLDEYRGKEIITKLEFLISSDYFLTANQNGPDSKFLKKTLIDNIVSIEEFNDISKSISVPDDTRSVLNNTYISINTHKNKGKLDIDR